MGKKPKLSIIVPCYNVEEYLEKCLESILGQTYRDFQLILVNDGSTDASLEICKKYQEKDERIEIINKENGGLVNARKSGVQAASGEYIGWVDSDDWIEPTYFEELIKAQEETGADVVAAGHFHDIGESSAVIKNGIACGVYSKEEILSKVLYTGTFYEYGITPQVYTKLVRSDLMRTAELAVDERIAAGEDAAVTYPILSVADKICITDICGYHYIQRQGSMTKVENPNEREKIRTLLVFLKNSFAEHGVWEIMQPQLCMYEKYMFTLRQIEIFDEDVQNHILMPFGGIPYGSRVVIYGAGVMGQKLVRYINASGKVSVVKWLDRNWENYREKGFAVDSPELLKENTTEYDHILIANISQNTAESIRSYLVDIGVDNEKIRWFSEAFMK